jgi:hypothetical protein
VPRAIGSSGVGNVEGGGMGFINQGTIFGENVGDIDGIS